MLLMKAKECFLSLSTRTIFHDGLTAWWTPEAKSYIEVNGFKDRQLRCIGETSKGSRYQGKLVGPEFCRGLDSYGFSDFKKAVPKDIER